MTRRIALDVLIFGGGAAGLWLLDQLSRRGDRVLLLEAGRLGQGQTVASQGIIHGGLKYTLHGLMTSAAREIREMPDVWRQCLAGTRTPDLRNTRLRSAVCHLWRSATLRSRLGMLGARVGLNVAPAELAAKDRPAVFAGCPGPVARIDEQVIAPASFVADLARQHHERLLQIDANTVTFALTRPGKVESVAVANPATGEVCEFHPRRVVLAAGAGNACLRRLCGLAADAMQRRPLHMVLVRGDLPEVNGHCVDGARTRVTVTTDRDSTGKTIWQVGGQLAEEGVALDGQSLICRAFSELTAVLPAVNFADSDWATHRVDRAERAMPQGGRPDTALVVSEENVVTAWPTKLALVPQLARLVESELPPGPSLGAAGADFNKATLAEWPRPRVAEPPWETLGGWQRLDRGFRSSDAA